MKGLHKHKITITICVLSNMKCKSRPNETYNDEGLINRGYLITGRYNKLSATY